MKRGPQIGEAFVQKNAETGSIEGWGIIDGKNVVLELVPSKREGRPSYRLVVYSKG